MEIAGAPQLWADLKNAPGRFLAIDYDGTLAPFQIDRMQAFPVRGAREALERIIRLPATGAAVVSGRPVREVSALLNLPGITIIGSHGWEEQKPGQPTRPHPLAPMQAAGLERAKQEAAGICGPGSIETKAGSVAIHTRGMDEVRAGKIRSGIMAAWSGLEAGGGLEIRAFNGGLELRAVGWDKGKALEALMEGYSLDTYFVYIGDDQTDEDAFRVVHGRGVGIRVGPGTVSSHATGYLKDCDAVVEFLDCWLRILDG